MFRVRCPICHKEAEVTSRGDWQDYPFCSRRCRLVDLGRWLNEDYRLATDDDEGLTPPHAGDADSPP